MKKLHLVLCFTIFVSLECAYVAELHPHPNAGVSPTPGRLVAWGRTNGPTKESETLKQLPGEEENNGFIHVSGHGQAWAALRKDGTVVMGGASKARPEFDKVAGKLVFIDVAANQIVAIDNFRNGYAWAPADHFTVKPDGKLENLVDISAAVGMGAAVSINGELITWGHQNKITKSLRKRFEPYQGKVASITAISYGGAFLTKGNRVVRWQSGGQKDIFDESTLPVNMVRPPIYESWSGNLLVKTASSWVNRGNVKIPAEVAQATRVCQATNALMVFEIAPRKWKVVATIPISEASVMQAFLDQYRPSAIAVVGGQPSEDPNRNGWGIVAIVPEEKAGEPVPETMPTETPSMRAEVPDPGEEAEHGITEPRFLALLKVYELEKEAKIHRPFEEAMSGLSDKLDAALALEEQSAVAQGDLESVTSIIAERESLKDDSYPPESETESERLQSLRKIWETESSKLGVESDLEAALLKAEFGKKLDDLIIILTKERKIEEALQVKSFREKE